MVFTQLSLYQTKFLRFHTSFWAVAFVILFLSGLSQSMSLEMAASRNILYASLGSLGCLPFIAFWESISNWAMKSIVFVLLLYAYTLGTLASLVVNNVMGIVFPEISKAPLTIFLFGGALNFSLVILVWCGFYLFLKQRLDFSHGEEEQKAANAISSISNITKYPEFIALERMSKISLLPVHKISLIKASGDYVEFTCDDETYLKRETLSNIIALLDPKLFQRVHRSAVINLTAIQEMEAKGRGDYTIILHSGEQVSCSRTYMSELKDRVDIAM